MQRAVTAGGRGTLRKRTDVRAVGTEGITGLIGLFCGAFVMRGGLNPVGAACLAAGICEGRSFYCLLVSVAAGFILGGGEVFFESYILCIALIGLFGIAAARMAKSVSVGIKALALIIAFTISGVVKGIAADDFLYISTIYILEGLVASSLVYVFDKGLYAVKAAVCNGVIERKSLLALITVAAFSAAGASLFYSGELPVHIILGYYLIFSACRSAGEVGIASGVITGLILFASGKTDMQMTVVMAAVAVMLSAFRSGGRAIYVIAGISLSAALGYYLGVFDFAWLLGVGVSAVLFLVFEGRMGGRLAVADGEGAGDSVSMRYYITERLMDCCRGIEALRKNFMAEKSLKRGSEEEITDLVDKTVCIACDNCPKYNNCWNSRYYDTYQTLMEIFGICAKRGSADEEELPAVFVDCCIKPYDFLEAANFVYSANRERLIWEMRLKESRQLAGEQLGAVAGIMKELAEELENRSGFKENLEKIILYELKRTEEIDRVAVREGKNGEYEVSVYTHMLKEDRDRAEHMANTIGDILGRKMCVGNMGEGYGVGTRGRIAFYERGRLKISAAAAMAIRDNESFSGDSYSFMELPRGGYMLALSDGMGSGRAAEEESRTVIELLEQLAEAGFKREAALKLINSALVMGSEAESLATIDMCYIDMYSGEAEFIKTGAAATFVIRDGRARAIRSASLPMGMLKYFDMEQAGCRLKRNDVIIMLTDGAAEIIDKDGMGEVLLNRLLEGERMKDPKAVAEGVLNGIKKRAGNVIKDDMTVVAARIWG